VLRFSTFCKCDDPNCPAGPMIAKIREMTTDGDVWEIEGVSGYTSWQPVLQSKTCRVGRGTSCQVLPPARAPGNSLSTVQRCKGTHFWTTSGVRSIVVSTQRSFIIRSRINGSTRESFATR
jgi:hypothetical protein